MRTVLVTLLCLSAHAFDFDDDEDLSATGPSTPEAFFAADDDAELSSAMLMHAIGDDEPRPRNKLFFKSSKNVEGTGGSVAVRVAQARLESADIDAVKALAKEGGYYTLSLPSVLSDPESPPVLASASACALLASRFEEHLQLTMSGKDRVAALSYVLPKVPARCPTEGLPRLALDEVLLNTSATQIFPREGPKPLGKIHDAAFLPPAAAAAAAKAAQASGADRGAGAGGEGGPPPENQSFLRKYWMYILPVVLVMSLGGAEPPPDGKGGEGGGGEGRPAAAAAGGARRK